MSSSLAFEERSVLKSLPPHNNKLKGLWELFIRGGRRKFFVCHIKSHVKSKLCTPKPREKLVQNGGMDGKIGWHDECEESKGGMFVLKGNEWGGEK